MYTDTSYKSTGPGFDTGKDFEATPDVKKPTEVGFMGLFRGFLGRTGRAKHAERVRNTKRVSFACLITCVSGVEVPVHRS